MGHKRVIVIGSGVSGLACARELTQRGYQVLVVEARSRVGGRLKGEPLRLKEEGEDGSPVYQAVDMGGALIHGIENNPVHRITTQMGVPLHAISDFCLLLDENGWPFDPKEDEKLSTLFNECLDAAFQRCALDKQSSNTFGALFDEVCQEKGIRPDSHPLLQWHKANLELPSGADFHQLGYTWNDDEPYGFAGDHAAVETSWKAVMEHLAEGLDIVYDSPVTRIQVVLPDGSTPTNTLSTVAPPPPPPPVTDTADATDETQPEVPVRVITETQWVASEKPVVHTPTRQSKRLKGEGANLRRSTRSTKGVIRLLQVGHDGTNLCYDDPFKTHISSRKRKNPSDTKKPSEKDKEEDERPASKVQVSLQNGTVLEADAVVCTLPLGILKLQPKDPGHVTFDPPLSEAKQTAIQQLGCGLLNKCVMSFPTVFWQDSDFLGLAKQNHAYLVLNVSKYTGKPILAFMYGGSFARELESWTDSDIVQDCLGVLKKICGKDVPTPIDYHVTRWGEEQYSHMAFTYIPPGVDGPSQLSINGDAIHDPVLPGKPLIMFAGEHTTPYHPSTMHGAFLSGIREAYRYDLFVEPELNDNMMFDTDHKIYEYTFPTRRVYKGPKRSSVAAAEQTTTPNGKASEIRSRRRRFAGMALRELPRKAAIDDNFVNGTPKSAPPTPEVVGSRRSQRSLANKKGPASYLEPESPEKGDGAKETQKRIDELEDRILLRSLESYGREVSLIRNKVLPVFGSSRRRSGDQIRRRWQKLGVRSRRSNVWKSWEAQTIAKATVPPTTKESTAATPERRSKRTPKPKVSEDV
eukprot:Nitzschia sp. Nitz4//scaffold1_size375055//31327//33744//NITZ4_000215-RA/size375055-processed-gene-0.298-mRNA-1//1//CDS//3329540862//1064//frame0